MRFIALALSLIFLSSCASSYGGLQIQGVNRPLLDLKKIAANSSPLGVRKISSNQREFTSKYFKVVGRKFQPAETLKERSYSVIYVLGDRRPYVVEVVVVNERMDAQGRYYDVGKDERIARLIKGRFQTSLSKRREDVNMIDDFRAF